MKEASNTDVIKVLVLAVILVGALLGLFFWNRQAHALDSLATKAYSLFVSR